MRPAAAPRRFSHFPPELQGQSSFPSPPNTWRSKPESAQVCRGRAKSSPTTNPPPQPRAPLFLQAGADPFFSPIIRLTSLLPTPNPSPFFFFFSEIRTPALPQYESSHCFFTQGHQSSHHSAVDICYTTFLPTLCAGSVTARTLLGCRTFCSYGAKHHSDLAVFPPLLFPLRTANRPFFPLQK